MAMIRPCSTAAGFMATPEQQRHVDLAGLKARLTAAGFTIMLDARVLLLVKKGTESTIYSNGKVLLKTAVKDEAEAAYEALAPHLEASW